MKQRIFKSLGLALVIAAAFGAGMFFMYWLMWADAFSNIIETIDRVTQ